ncbi:MAG: SDR family oxidoreductase [Comamonadaceae bacterium]|nr:SDR family oxidoreductase [Comamonadaceae bacterium]
MICDFDGKTAVLTGAGSGFGLECARIAAARGMHLVLVDVQQDALARAAAELQPQLAARGRQLLAQRVDVSDAAAMQALAQQVQRALGAPHFVFNNAGVSAAGLVWEHTPEEWAWVMGVNLMGVVHGVHSFTPMMLQAARQDPAWRGHIVNTASMAGLLTPPNMGLYNVSKHAVVALTETLYQDLRLLTEQIGASVLCPYFVPTGIADSGRNRPQALAGQALTASQRLGQAMGQKAVQAGKVSAADVAHMVFEAIAQDRFYIYSHPQALGPVQTRLEDIMQQRNPSDPFAHKPELGEQLRQQLRQ